MCVHTQAGRRGAALAVLRQAVAGVGHEKARAEVVRATRLTILVRAWGSQACMTLSDIL